VTTGERYITTTCAALVGVGLGYIVGVEAPEPVKSGIVWAVPAVLAGFAAWRVARALTWAWSPRRGFESGYTGVSYAKV
jgi:hypothetical protein